MLTSNAPIDKDLTQRLAKASQAFGRLNTVFGMTMHETTDKDKCLLISDNHYTTLWR